MRSERILAVGVLSVLFPLIAHAAVPFDRGAYEAYLDRLALQRAELANRYQRAPARDRRAIRDEARQVVTTAIRDHIFPAWLGTPWGLGPTSTAIRPHEPGKVVGCSYFVTAVLLNAGLRLASRGGFAVAPSELIQRALTPAKRDLHRLFRVEGEALRRRIAALGDGIYMVGLNIHTGFLVVNGAEVRVVHASYAPPMEVVDEPLLASEVIAWSAARGYVVTPLFQDDFLIDAWLSGRPVPAPRWSPRGPRGR
jgi:hypothetical protein